MHIYRKLSLTLKRIPKIPIKLNFILTCITNLPLEIGFRTRYDKR
jgi:hypothetical protein